MLERGIKPQTDRPISLLELPSPFNLNIVQRVDPALISNLDVADGWLWGIYSVALKLASWQNESSFACFYVTFFPSTAL